jgi:hypothetical protein
MEAVNAPVVDLAPLSTLLSDTVGVPVVFQHTPWAVGFGTPNEVTFPFPRAVVVPIDDAAWVVTVGAIGDVVNITSVPYEVPPVFVA